MCENKINTLAAQIADVLWCKSGISANVDNLSWVLQRFRIEEKQERQIDKAELREIIKVISTVPTGKQRHYRHALDHILSYLKEECLWDLPEEAEKRLVDRDNQWISQIACEAGKNRSGSTTAWRATYSLVQSIVLKHLQDESYGSL